MFTPEEQKALDRLKGSTSPSSGGFSGGQMQQASSMFSPEEQAALNRIKGIKEPAAAAPVEPVKRSAFIDSMENIRPEYVQKGMGSGKEFYNEKTGESGTRRTFGDIYKNISEGLGDIAVGTAKAVIRTPVHLGQIISKMNGYGGNNIFNKDSAQGQYFDSATKGKTGLQKFGATAADLTMMAVPVGAVEKATVAGAQGAMKALPKVAQVVEQAGTLGKFARAIPKIVGSAAGGAVGDAMSQGRVTPGGVAAGAVGGAVGLAAARKLLGRTPTLAELAEIAGNKIDEGDSFAIGKKNQAVQDFNDSFDKLIKGKRLQDKIEKANGKLSSLDDNGVKDVRDVIFRNGGSVGEIVTDPSTGKQVVSTQKVTEKYLKDIGEYAKKNDALLATQKDPIIVSDARDQILAGLLRGKNNVEKANITSLFDDLTKDYLGMDKEKISLSDLISNNRTIRNTKGRWSFGGDNSKVEDIRRIVKAVDDYGYNKVSGDSATHNELRNEMMKLYDARDVLDEMNGKPIPGYMNNAIARLLGNVAGYATGGGPATSFLLGGVGGEAADAANSMAGRMKVSGAASNPYIQELSKRLNRDAIAGIFERADNAIARNQSKNAAEKAANQAYQDLVRQAKAKTAAQKKTLRDLVDSIIGYKGNRLQSGVNPMQIEPPVAGAPNSFKSDGSVIHVPPGGFNMKGSSLKDYLGSSR